MPIPHYNYYPPSGEVVDSSNPRAQWNGRVWMLNGRPYSVPSGHKLVGRPGGKMSGWYYDWQKRAWMEPSKPAGQQQPQRGPQPPAPAPRPMPMPVPVPVPVSQQPARQPEKEMKTVETKKPNALDALIKHPVAPVLGGLLVLVAQFTEAPVPPTIPNDLPDPTAKQWQMIYAQNQQAFQRRMELYNTLGLVLLGYASTQTVLDALPAKRAA